MCWRSTGVLVAIVLMASACSGHTAGPTPSTVPRFATVILSDDPQGVTVRSGLDHMGFGEVKEVRVGKYIEIRLDAPSQDEAHRRVGLRAAEIFDAICVVQGDHARMLAEASGAELVPDRAAAAEWVRRTAAPGDRVLVKASHGVRLDELVKELTAA